MDKLNQKSISNILIKKKKILFKQVLAILSIFILLGAVFPIVENVEAQTHDQVWDSGDVRQMVIFMADNWDPATEDWTFPEESEDRAIAEEMLRVMEEIEELRGKFPYSAEDVPDKLGEAFIGLAPIEDTLNALQNGIALLRSDNFNNKINDTFNKVPVLGSVGASLFIEVKNDMTDVLEEKLTDAESELKALPEKAIEFTIEKLDIKEKIGDKLDWVLPLADIAVIIISHMLISYIVSNYEIAFSSIVSHLITYEVGNNPFDLLSGSVEHTKLYFDIFAVGAEWVGSKVGADIGLKLGASFGTAITPGVGTAIGAALGYVIGEWVGGTLAREAVEFTYDYLTQKEYLSEPSHNKFERFLYEKNVKIEIVDIWSPINDNYVPWGEILSVKIKNTGSLPADVQITPINDDWTLFAIPDSSWDVKQFLSNLIDIVCGPLQINTRSEYLLPGETRTISYFVTPLGLTWNFPWIKKYSYDNIGFTATYKHSQYTPRIIVGSRHEGFTSASPGPAFLIIPNPSNELYSRGDNSNINITVQNVGTQTGTFTLGVSFRHKELETEYGGVLITPIAQYTLAPGNSYTFNASWTIPLTAPQGQYQIAVNCWENPYEVLYPDNIWWEDIFIVSSPLSGSYLYAELYTYANLSAIDPAGREISNISNFPNASYQYNTISGKQSINITNLTNGLYIIRMTGTGNGNYNLNLNVTHNFISKLSKGYSATILSGEIHEVYVNITIENGILSATASDLLKLSQIQQPTADAGGDKVTEEGKETPFDGSGSSAPGGKIILYEWDFNNDGIADATGIYATYIWYDNYQTTVTLTITAEYEKIGSDDSGNTYIDYEYRTNSITISVTVKNKPPEVTIDRAYMYVDFTLRATGEKWHDVTWTLFENDIPIASLHVERYPGDPDAQSDTVYDVYIDMEKVYIFNATYNPYEDDNPINGQLNGANPIWIILTFEDDSQEIIHHTFNVQQSIIKGSDHWLHVEPWWVDLSPYFVNHTITFEGTVRDKGTDDEDLTWDWDDATPTAQISDWDEYWSLVAYFNSIRELGSAKTTMEDDIQNRVAKPVRNLRIEELTSRIDSKELPDILTKLNKMADEEGAIDILACSNMFSVGVDVQRLGLMVMNNQPKSTSEYIQSTGRVGRNKTGLVIILYNWARPRDQSHFERFFDYHNRIQSHVEAMTVTPFSRGVRERALHGQYVSLVRILTGSNLARNSEAVNYDMIFRGDAVAKSYERMLEERMRSITGGDARELREEVEHFLDQWIDWAMEGELSYHRVINEQNILLKKIEDPTSLRGVLTPISMRNVEEEISLHKIWGLPHS